MLISENNILRHELIGLNVEVVDSANKKNIGIKGRIIDETYRTIKIDYKGNEKTLFKGQVVLKMNLPNKKKIEVEGKFLVGRPWDRVKKIKNM